MKCPRLERRRCATLAGAWRVVRPWCSAPSGRGGVWWYSPSSQASQRASVGVLRSGQELVPHGAEEALDLALADGLVGARVDQMHVVGGDQGRQAAQGVQPRPVADGLYGGARTAVGPAFRRSKVDGPPARLARRRQAGACSARRTVAVAVYGGRRRHRIKSCSLPVRSGTIRFKTATSQRISAIYNTAS